MAEYRSFMAICFAALTWIGILHQVIQHDRIPSQPSRRLVATTKLAEDAENGTYEQFSGTRKHVADSRAVLAPVGMVNEGDEAILPINSSLLSTSVANKSLGAGHSMCSEDSDNSAVQLIDCTKRSSSFLPSLLAQCEDLGDAGTVSVVPIKSIAPASSTLSPKIHWHEEDLSAIQERAREVQTYEKSIVSTASDEALNREIVTNMFHKANEPLSVAIIQNAYGHLKTGRVQTCGKQIQFNQCTEDHDLIHINTDNVVHKFDRAIFVAGLYTANIFHSTLEHFPRIAMLRDLLRSDSDIPVVIRKRKHMTLLVQQLLDIPLDRIVALDANEVIYADVMYVPEPTPCMQVQPAQAAITRYAVSQKVKQKPSDILIIRRRGSRSLLNHEELEKSLRAALPGESIVIFDDKNLPASGIPQFQMFANAKVIIGPHGAGLSNMVAAPPNSAVVEFLTIKGRFTLCFLLLATALGLEYHPLVMYPKNDGFVVNVTSVVGVVSEIIKRQERYATVPTIEVLRSG